MTSDTVLVTAADGAFAPAAAVALLSATCLVQPRPPCLILDCGLPKAMAGAIERLFARHQVVLHRRCVDRTLLSGLPTMAHLKPPTYARLAAPQLARAIARRSLYLDADTLTVSSIAMLLATDLAGRPAAAVQDPTVPFVSAPGGVVGWAQRGLVPAIAEFNAGVLLIDNETWLSRGVSEDALELLRARPEEATFADQGALNAALGGDWIPLSGRWNFAVPRSLGVSVRGRVLSRHRLTVMRDIGILHFTGIVKPWEADYSPSPFRRIYNDAFRHLAPELPAPRYHTALRWARARR